MQRRTFFISGILGTLLMNRVLADPSPQALLENAAQLLASSVESGLVRSAVLLARSDGQLLERAYGEANIDSPFLLGSISKPISIAALMTLYDSRAFDLDDAATRFLPEFHGSGREEVTVRHLLTHVSGLPDQLPNNAALRRSHASLADFVQATMQLPLAFKPGTKYEYSSMAILLAAEIAQRITNQDFKSLVQNAVLSPLDMQRSAIGRGTLAATEFVPMQTEHAAPEAGGGDPDAKDWDWNSDYWRNLGAPWGGVHASAGDLLRFLDAFDTSEPKFLSVDTARLMIRNHNAGLLVPRGLGFALGPITLSPRCGVDAFGHTGSTGTIAWHDPVQKQTCIVLTGLPAEAVKPHPRDLASAALAQAAT